MGSHRSRREPQEAPPASTTVILDQLLAAARLRTGMELAWITSSRDESTTIVRTSGPAERFGLAEGDEPACVDSYDTAIVEGQAIVVTDTAADVSAASAPFTRSAGIRSWVVAPIDDDGRLVGTLAVASKTPRPDLGPGEADAMTLMARVIADVSTTDSRTLRHERALQARIQSEIDDDRITTVYQPIVTTTDGRIVGAEALSRFSQAPAQPDQWFREAGQVGRGTVLDLAAITQALRGLDRLDPDVYLSLNASPRTVANGELAAALERHHPERLVVEITEYSAVTGLDTMVEGLRRLRELGVRIAVDDVGAGFTSLAHILELRPDIVKIDGDLVRRIDHDPIRRRMVRTIVEMGNRIGAELVAEGVETAEELAVLGATGVSQVQGYAIARPRPLPLAKVVMPTVEIEPEPSTSIVEDGLGAQRFELAMLHSPIGAALVGLDGSFLDVNPALVEMLGHPRDDLLAMTFQQITHPDDLNADLQLLHDCLDGARRSYRIDKRYYAAGGAIVWGDLSVVLVRDAAGDPAYFISQILDVTTRRQREAHFEEQATTDPLTGVANRTAALATLDRLHRARTAYGLLFCDLNGFKAVNDSYGHNVGDLVLAEATTRLRSTARSDDIVARWGGDEFVIIAPGADESGVGRLSARIEHAFGAPVVIDSTLSLAVEVTVGVALRDRASAETPDDVVDRADRDMYERRGRQVSEPDGR